MMYSRVQKNSKIVLEIKIDCYEFNEFYLPLPEAGYNTKLKYFDLNP